MLRAILEAIGTVVAPSRCAACDEDVRIGRAFCPPCAATIEPAEPSAYVRAVGGYGGALAVAIRRLKYGGRTDLARPLGDLLGRAIEGVEADLLVPIPLGDARLVSRGYNQAALLASRAARVAGLRAMPVALARTRETLPQATLDRERRRANVEGAFSGSAALAGRRVVLVDDVLTTGATLEAAHRAVREAGGEVVTRAVVAVV